MGNVPPSNGPHEPLTAERIRQLIMLAVAEHPQVVEARGVDTVYRDRIALGIQDHANQIWRVHILTDPLR
jgi:hypothetical protein